MQSISKKNTKSYLTQYVNKTWSFKITLGTLTSIALLLFYNLPMIIN